MRKPHFYQICFMLPGILLLTVLSQVGGLLLLLIWVLPSRWFCWRIPAYLGKTLVFVALYLFSSFWILPQLAAWTGREALPLSGNIRPASWYIPLTNRHYVKPALAQLLRELSAAHPNQDLYYLDAGFPFWDSFYMVPHLSHADGRKIDLAFQYVHSSTGEQTTPPGWTGYGNYEQPIATEQSHTDMCTKEGFWMYAAMSYFSGPLPAQIRVDTEASSTLIKWLAKQAVTEKLFLEPYLKARWGLADAQKVRFQGCHAARHDDHIHLQVY